MADAAAVADSEPVSGPVAEGAAAEEAPAADEGSTPTATGIVAGLSAADLTDEAHAETATPRTVMVQINHQLQEVKVEPPRGDDAVCVAVDTHGAHGGDVLSVNHRVTRRRAVSAPEKPGMPGLPTAEAPVRSGSSVGGAIEDDMEAHMRASAEASGKAGKPDPESAALTPTQQFAINLSFGVNVVLAIIKLVAAIASGSIVVIASGCIIFVTARAITKRDLARYPVGKTRLAPVGIIVFASVMGTSTATIVLESLKGLAEGQGEALDLQPFVIVILSLTIVFKGLLYLLCASASKGSSAVGALAEDHRNDLLSNVVAVVAAVLAAEFPDSAWWCDGVGAIVVGIYIIVVWVYTGWEEVRKLAGFAAEPADIQEILEVAVNWHPAMDVDKIRAYHHGEFYLCELEILLPRDMTVEHSHHIGLALQQRIERFKLVERCFVHIDYKRRPHEEHFDPATGKHGTFEA